MAHTRNMKSRVFSRFARLALVETRQLGAAGEQRAGEPEADNRSEAVERAGLGEVLRGFGAAGLGWAWACERIFLAGLLRGEEGL